MDRPKYSIVIPVKDEIDNIAPMVKEITEALGNQSNQVEVIFVDDGSSDGTLDEIKRVAKEFPVVRYLSFERNAGQTAAFDAGLRAAEGELLVMIDGDLQNDPADIPKMAGRIGEADIVCGYRATRKDSIVRKISSKIANGVRNKITNEDIIDVGCSLKVMRRECIEQVKLYNGMHRFFPTLVKLNGFKMVQVPVNHRPRQHGRTKYGISNRLWKGIADLFAVRWMQRRYLKYRIKERG
ncbi:MAG TPA: glycosyltransferase family 2 protein [candidate division Zixibacteria bacterium]|nr:glycosyltransferase family 2 protein [candidate division Zixibacteria bacterium]